MSCFCYFYKVLTVRWLHMCFILLQIHSFASGSNVLCVEGYQFLDWTGASAAFVPLSGSGPVKQMRGFVATVLIKGSLSAFTLIFKPPLTRTETAFFCYFSLFGRGWFHFVWFSTVQLHVTWQPSCFVGSFNELALCGGSGYLYWNQSHVSLTSAGII